jgi:hypothetical protein
VLSEPHPQHLADRFAKIAGLESRSGSKANFIDAWGLSGLFPLAEGKRSLGLLVHVEVFEILVASRLAVAGRSSRRDPPPIYGAAFGCFFLQDALERMPRSPRPLVDVHHSQQVTVSETRKRRSSAGLIIGVVLILLAVAALMLAW